MNIYKVGLIGLGRQGQKHLEALRTLEKQKKLRIQGICDIQPSSVSGNLPYFSDFRELYKTKPDIVIIATPNILHYEMVKSALKEGIHVIKEKPLALNYQEAKYLVTMANTNDKQLMVLQQRYHDPLFQYLRSIVASLGPVKNCYYQFTLQDTTQSWYWKKAWGGGAWLNMGWHAVCLLQWLVGDIQSLDAAHNSGGMRSWEYDTEHSSFAKVQFASGASGSFFVSCVHDKQEQVKIVCENGLIYANRTHVQVITKSEKYNKTFEPDEKACYTNQLLTMITAISQQHSQIETDLHIQKLMQLPIAYYPFQHVYE